MIDSTIKIAVIVSKFNAAITTKLCDGTLKRLLQCGLNKNQIDVINVPGAVEIPLTAKLMANSKRYQAIICLGAVIRGETNHYEYVCLQVSNGCQQIMLEFSIPVIFGVLTTHNEQQALDRVSDARNHKGMECADAAIEMLKVIEEVKRLGNQA